MTPSTGLSDTGLRSILIMRLVMITEGANVLCRHCHSHITQHHDRQLSLRKFIKRPGRMPELADMINAALADLKRPPGEAESATARRAWEHLVRYCCYDKRKRKNFFGQSNG